MPNRRQKCPFCNKYINIKTIYPDNVRKLVTEEKAKQIDQYWRIRQMEGERDHFPTDWQVVKNQESEDNS
jgi:hypothetical protein